MMGALGVGLLMKSSKKVLWVVAALIFTALVVVPWLSGRSGGVPATAGEWSYTELLRHLEQDEIVQVRLDPAEHTLYVLATPGVKPNPSTSGRATPAVQAFEPSVPLPAGLTWKVVLPPTQSGPSDTLVQAFEKHHVDFQVIKPSGGSDVGAVLMVLVTALLPTALIIGFLYWMFRRSGGAAGTGPGGVPGRAGFRAMNRGFSPVEPEDNSARLSDVAGCEEVKVEVAEFIAFLKDPEHYRRVAARMTRGVLMVGPPGTGKTLLARAIAGEAKVPFFAVSGSDFVEMFVGVGASRVRELFNAVKKFPAAIVFIDEIDAIGRRRNSGMGVGDTEREQTLNQLLVEMDGFTQGQNVVVLAASNRADVLDPALLRPGRFDRHIQVPLPDKAARAEILAEHARKVPLASDVSLDELARGTVGFSGADLSNLVNEAALLAGRKKARLVTRAFFNEAHDKILMGQARAGGIKNARERKVVAYHEAGHAIVARFLPRAEPVHKITIMPRGQALGVTVQLPEEESFNHDSEMLETTLRVLMGGRAAEESVLKVRTVGASNDFARATRLARSMVATWGMNAQLGVVVYRDEEAVAAPVTWSQTWQERVDGEVFTTVQSAYADALAILNVQHELLEAVAQALLTDETLDAAQFEALVQQHGHNPPVRSPVAEAASISPIPTEESP